MQTLRNKEVTKKKEQASHRCFHLDLKKKKKHAEKLRVVSQVSICFYEENGKCCRKLWKSEQINQKPERIRKGHFPRGLTNPPQDPREMLKNKRLS